MPAKNKSLQPMQAVQRERQSLGVQRKTNSHPKIVIFSAPKAEDKSALKIILYYKNHQISTAQIAQNVY